MEAKKMLQKFNDWIDPPSEEEIVRREDAAHREMVDFIYGGVPDYEESDDGGHANKHLSDGRYVWADPSEALKQLRFHSGDLYLGREVFYNERIGVKTDRHAMTIAGPRTGKGVCTVIPNLFFWPHNALVIDPKGEAAEATAKHRAAMGQDVHVLDPFHVSDVEDRFRARFNPLENIDPKSFTAREDIGVLSDGLVMRHDPKGGHWDGGGLSVISGLTAHVLTGGTNQPKTLSTVRDLINSSPDEFAAVIEAMQENDGCGKLAKTAASKLTKTGTEAGHFLSVADENTKWLDSEPINDLLANSTFNLADLKTKPCTVYLVLPAKYLNEHGRFLRLFVRMALNVMQGDEGFKGGRECLFLLDEFYALGFISEISKTFGLLPGAGLKLWPILHNVEQIDELYGREGWGNFTGASGVVQFFGNNDEKTLERIDAMMHNQVDRHAILKQHVAKGLNAKVARRSMNFVNGIIDPVNARPSPWFSDPDMMHLGK